MTNSITQKAVAGVYQFKLKNQLINYPNGQSSIFYIGSSNDVEQRIQQHVSGSGDPCVYEAAKKYACVYETFPTQNYKQEEANALTNFKIKFGAYPHCNDKG